MKIIVASNNYAKIRAISQVFEKYFPRIGSINGFEGAFPFDRIKKYPEEANDPFYNENDLVSLVKKQAKEAYHEHDYKDEDKTRKIFELSIATKEGLINQDFGANSGFFVTEGVAIYNGERFLGIGFGPKLEVPKGLIKRLYEFKSKSIRAEYEIRPLVEEVVGWMEGLEGYFSELTRGDIVDDMTKEVVKVSLEKIVHQMTHEPSELFKLGLVGLLSRDKLRRSDCIQQAVSSALLPIISNNLYKNDEMWMKK